MPAVGPHPAFRVSFSREPLLLSLSLCLCLSLTHTVQRCAAPLLVSQRGRGRGADGRGVSEWEGGGGRSVTPLSLPGRDHLPAILPAAGSMKLSMRSPKLTMPWPPDMRAPACARAHALAVGAKSAGRVPGGNGASAPARWRCRRTIQWPETYQESKLTRPWPEADHTKT